MSFESIYADIKKGQYEPVYFLCGEEAYFIDKISDYIEEHAITEAEKAFNQVVLYGKEIDHKTIEDNARQYPMMANKRVVIVKEAQNLRGIENLLPYFQNPSPQTILVINYKYKKADKRTAFGKAVAKNSCYLETKKLYDNQVGSWINNYLRSTGVQIDAGADELLAEYLGTDLSKITNELDKMLLNIGEGKRITKDIIQDNIGISKDYNVFELQKTLGFKDKVKTYRIIHYMGENPKMHPLPLITGSLYNYFGKLMIAKANAAKGDQVMMKALGLSTPFFLKEYKIACQKYTMDELKVAINALAKADRHSKGIGSRNHNVQSILLDFASEVFS